MNLLLKLFIMIYDVEVELLLVVLKQSMVSYLVAWRKR